MKGTAFTRFDRFVVLLLVLTACVAWGPSTAVAGESSTIVLVASRPEASLIANLRGELTTLGMRVVVVQRGDGEISPGELTEAARHHHANAAFRVLVEQGKVEVWLADRVTGKVLLREVLTTKGGPQTQTDENTVVARAVELLRASLLELDIDDRPAGEVRAPATLPPALRAPVATRFAPGPSRWGLTTSAVWLQASSRATASLGLGVALEWRPLTHLGAAARLTLPIASATYVAAQGRARVTPRWTSLGLRWNSADFWRTFRASLEAGGALVFIDVVGIANKGYSGSSSFDLDPVIYLAGDLRYLLSPNLAGSLGVVGGRGLKPSEILFDTEFIDRYGQWMFIGLLGLELAWN
jgi:hypothetical protein